MNNTERDSRIAELKKHRTSMLTSLARDIEYALKHEDIQFAAPAINIFSNLIQCETSIRTLAD